MLKIIGTGTGIEAVAEVKAISGEGPWIKTQEVDIEELLLLVRALERTIASLLSHMLTGKGF